jgi:hypothetical protein
MILEQFLVEPKEFRPTNIKEYTVLQIARQFNALHQLKTYLLASERHSFENLLKAYRRARAATDPHSAFFRSF